MINLLKPTWMSEDREKAIKAIGSINTSQEILDAVKSALLTDVRVLATHKIDNEDFLIKAALNEENFMVRRAALDRIINLTKNRAFLYDIAEKLYDDGYEDMCYKAWEKLILSCSTETQTEPWCKTYQTDFANNKNKESINIDAEVINNDGAFNRHMTAIGDISNQSVIADIAMHDKIKHARISAARRLIDPSIIYVQDMQNEYCNMDDHLWNRTYEKIDRSHNDPLFVMVTYVYQCIYCGKEKTERYREGGRGSYQSMVSKSKGYPASVNKSVDRRMGKGMELSYQK